MMMFGDASTTAPARLLRLPDTAIRHISMNEISADRAPHFGSPFAMVEVAGLVQASAGSYPFSVRLDALRLCQR